ncbi:TPA: hypothetical protein N2896_001504 [Vibrio parahaemolyticus]|uniref:hypothetical protein n=1 Tax=Vibrio parahaemolyticus TaxID=670 RepID=UPI00111F3647|nr:hypothetical protein [Vibrio parahaemolyticus]MBE4442632.1 hypothetical protein [Vibrio parahaemolyticus]TOH40486.1 hypothetical protein CGI82_10655 [Vibrio parahaemolyticus]HCM1298191.1 hypothetical protein [Vibrio parahaemolyticus]
MLDSVRSIWLKPIDKWEDIKESLTYFSASSKLEGLDERDVDSLSLFLDSHRTYQDKFTLKVFYDVDESIEFSNGASIESTLEKLESLRDEISNLECDEYLSVSIFISKQLLEPLDSLLVDNIYSLDTLSAYLNTLTLTQLHNVISERYGRRGVKGVALVGDFSTSFNTDYFHFIPRGEFQVEKLQPQFSDSRAEEIHKLRGALGHFANASTWFLLPDHFKLTGALDAEFSAIYHLFNALHNTYLISFISNFSIIDDRGIEYRLKGLKDISGSYDFEALKHIDASELWELYQWVYEGNTVDKLGITRNIIPLHVDDLLSVNSAVSVSAYSSFILSQKDDVKSYIETTKKVAEQIQVTSQKASEVAEKIANSIKTGVLGVTTFAISTILFRIFTKGSELKSYSDLFAFIGSPLFVSMIVFALAVFTGLFGFAWYESKQDQARFKDMYCQFKKTYELVLTRDDMENLLEKDAYFDKSYLFITQRRNMYTRTWGAVLLASLTILMLASCYADKLQQIAS